MAKCIEEYLSYLIGRNQIFVGVKPISIPWNVLEHRGLISSIEPATEARCSHGELVKIEWVHSGNVNIPTINCSKCGRVHLSENDIQRWRAKFTPFLNQITEKFEIKGKITPVIRKMLWNLGWRTGEPWFFLRWCTMEEVKLVKNIIDQTPKAMILTGLSKTAENASFFWPGRTISMDVCADLSLDGELILNREVLEAYGIFTRGPSHSDKATNRTNRTTKIEILVKELKEFVKRSRIYAQEHKYDDDFQPLFRPSIKELSQSTGLPKSTISRCLKDEHATVLRTLWERLKDPWSILPK